MIAPLTIFQFATPVLREARKRFDEVLDKRMQFLESNHPELWKDIKSLNPKLQRALILSSFAGLRGEAPTKSAVSVLSKAVSELNADAKVITAGVWDLNSYCEELPRTIELLNRPQAKLAFFPVRAAIHAGLISDRERVRAWLKENGRKLGKAESRQVEENTIAEDFYPQAEKVRKQTGLEYLVGITRSMIAFAEEGSVEFNYFASCEGHTPLVSTYGLKEYAARGGRPVEVVVVAVILSILVVMLSPKLDYHEETRGCLFDFNADRDSIVESIRACIVCEDCLGKVRADLREPMMQIMEGFRKYKPAAASRSSQQAMSQAARK